MKFPAASQNKGPVLLTTCTNIIEAERIKAILKTANIDCFIDEGITKINPLLVGAVGWIKILVAKRDEERAKKLLA